jgi:deoxyribodipyrimidine photo-lyase
MNSTRICKLNKHSYSSGSIVYWTSRDQRIRYNHALIHAQEKALKYNCPLIVLFCLVPEFIGATIRQYNFMLKGLKEIEHNLKEKNIPFMMLTGQPYKEIPAFLNSIKAGYLITDFDPLRIKQQWQKKVNQAISIPFDEVDTHNIVPCRVASQKQEYAARTIRPKIHRLLNDYLFDPPQLQKHPVECNINFAPVNWKNIHSSLKIDQTVSEVDWLTPGEEAANKMLDHFITRKLDKYGQDRNDPACDALSNMSPYLHFGQISALQIALKVNRAKANEESKESYLEELIVRKELSDNYCFYNSDYDNLKAIPEWVKKTYEAHKDDIRPYLYTLKELENAQTHEDAWNACQLEMIKTGKMQGYMRMYWAKKIFEWTESPEQALEFAIYLNDKYELDGRDPNGYTGIMWSIAGVHDRGWTERPVFGKIRYMNYNGLKSKFNIKAYIDKWTKS